MSRLNQQLIILSLIFTILLFGTVVPAMSQQQTEDHGKTAIVDLSKVDPAIANMIRAEMQKEKSDPAITTEKVRDWSKISVELADAVKALCNALNTEVNDFIKTPAGMIFIGIITWITMGPDLLAVGSSLWDVVGGILAFFCINGIIMWSFKHFHMQKKIKTKEGDEVIISYERNYNFNNDGNEFASTIIHLILFAFTTLVCLFIVF